MSERPVSIMSINIGRQSQMLSALLQTSTADILLIQEPWHGPISTSRSDSDPLGLTVLGVTANNKWQIYYPRHDEGDTCNVMIQPPFFIFHPLLKSLPLRHPHQPLSQHVHSRHQFDTSPLPTSPCHPHHRLWIYVLRSGLPRAPTFFSLAPSILSHPLSHLPPSFPLSPAPTYHL